MTAAAQWIREHDDRQEPSEQLASQGEILCPGREVTPTPPRGPFRLNGFHDALFSSLLAEYLPLEDLTSFIDGIRVEEFLVDKALALMIVFGDSGLVELSRRRSHQQALAGQNETLARENVSLYRTIQRLKNDPVYIESVARNELGMIGKDDVILLRAGNRRPR